MKTNRILSLCLGLGLIFSLSACEGVTTNFRGIVGVDEATGEPYISEDEDEDEDDGDEEGEEEKSFYDYYHYELIITNKEYVSSMYIEEETPITTKITREDEFGRFHSDIESTSETVVLTSSNEAVVSVGTDLTLIAVSEGEAVVTAAYVEHPEDVLDTVTIKVSEELNAHVLTITNKEELESSELVFVAPEEEDEEEDLDLYLDDVVEETEPITLEISVELTAYHNKAVVEDDPTEASIENVTLTSSNEDVAVVSEEELSVTISGVGTAVISATWTEYAEEESATDSVTLTVLEPASEEPGDDPEEDPSGDPTGDPEDDPE